MIRYWYIRSQSLVSGGWEIEFIAATGFDIFAIYCWLVVEPTHLKNKSSSIGMMTFPRYGNKKTIFQTTNQFVI